MPFDKQKYDYSYVKNNYYPRIAITMHRSEPAAYSALKYAAKQANMSVCEYCRQAVLCKLIADDYLRKTEHGYMQVIRDEIGNHLLIDI